MTPGFSLAWPASVRCTVLLARPVQRLANNRKKDENNACNPSGFGLVWSQDEHDERNKRPARKQTLGVSPSEGRPGAARSVYPALSEHAKPEHLQACCQAQRDNFPSMGIGFLHNEGSSRPIRQNVLGAVGRRSHDDSATQRRNGRNIQKERIVNCPKCKGAVAPNTWVHPTCPKCKHGNAIFSSGCRDCGHKDSALENKFQYECRRCNHIWLTTGGFAILK